MHTNQSDRRYLQRQILLPKVYHRGLALSHFSVVFKYESKLYYGRVVRGAVSEQIL